MPHGPGATSARFFRNDQMFADYAGWLIVATVWLQIQILMGD